MGVIMQKERIFLGSLPPNVSESKIHDIFKQYGTIRSVVLHDGKQGKSKYGFVIFWNAEAAEKAIKATKEDQLFIDGQKIFVNTGYCNVKQKPRRGPLFEKTLSLLYKDKPLHFPMRKSRQPAGFECENIEQENSLVSSTIQESCVQEKRKKCRSSEIIYENGISGKSKRKRSAESEETQRKYIKVDYNILPPVYVLLPKIKLTDYIKNSLLTGSTKLHVTIDPANTVKSVFTSFSKSTMVQSHSQINVPSVTTAYHKSAKSVLPHWEKCANTSRNTASHNSLLFHFKQDSASTLSKASHLPPLMTSVSSPMKAMISPPLKTVISPPMKTVILPPLKTSVSPPMRAMISPPMKAMISPPMKTVISPHLKTSVSPPIRAMISPPMKTSVSPLTRASILSPLKTPVSPPMSTVVSPPMKTSLLPPVKSSVSPPVIRECDTTCFTESKDCQSHGTLCNVVHSDAQTQTDPCNSDKQTERGPTNVEVQCHKVPVKIDAKTQTVPEIRFLFPQAIKSDNKTGNTAVHVSPSRYRESYPPAYYTDIVQENLVFVLAAGYIPNIPARHIPFISDLEE